MIRTKKVLHKLLAAFVSAAFFINSTGITDVSALAPQAGSNSVYGQMRRVMEERYAEHEGIDEIIEKLKGKAKNINSISGLYNDFEKCVKASGVRDAINRLKLTLSSTGGKIQVIFVGSEDELPRYLNKPVWGHAGKYVTVFALEEENLTETGRRKIIARLFHEIRARSETAKKLFEKEYTLQKPSLSDLDDFLLSIMLIFEEDNRIIADDILRYGRITDKRLREEFAALLFAVHQSKINRDYAMAFKAQSLSRHEGEISPGGTGTASPHTDVQAGRVDNTASEEPDNNEIIGSQDHAIVKKIFGAYSEEKAGLFKALVAQLDGIGYEITDVVHVSSNNGKGDHTDIFEARRENDTSSRLVIKVDKYWRDDRHGEYTEVVSRNLKQLNAHNKLQYYYGGGVGVKVFEFGNVRLKYEGKHKVLHYQVQEYIDGTSIDDFIRMHKDDPGLDEIIIKAVVEYVSYMRELFANDVIHADAFHGNTLINSQGRLRVIDPDGIACVGSDTVDDFSLLDLMPVYDLISYIDGIYMREGLVSLDLAGSLSDYINVLSRYNYGRVKPHDTKEIILSVTDGIKETLESELAEINILKEERGPAIGPMMVSMALIIWWPEIKKTIVRFYDKIKKIVLREYIKNLRTEEQKERSAFVRKFIDENVKAVYDERAEEVDVVHHYKQFRELNAYALRLGHMVGPAFDIVGDIIEQHEKLVSQGMLKPGEKMRVLDIVCGFGYFAKQMANLEELKKYGIELEVTGLGLKRYPEDWVESDNVKYVEGYAEDMPKEWANKFHYAVSVAMLRYSPDPLKVLEETHRVLVPGGKAVIDAMEVDVSALPTYWSLLLTLSSYSDKHNIGIEGNRIEINKSGAREEGLLFPFRLKKDMPVYQMYEECDILDREFYFKVPPVKLIYCIYMIMRSNIVKFAGPLFGELFFGRRNSGMNFAIGIFGRLFRAPGYAEGGTGDAVADEDNKKDGFLLSNAAKRVWEDQAVRLILGVTVTPEILFELADYADFLDKQKNIVGWNADSAYARLWDIIRDTVIDTSRAERPDLWVKAGDAVLPMVDRRAFYSRMRDKAQIDNYENIRRAGEKAGMIAGDDPAVAELAAHIFMTADSLRYLMWWEGDKHSPKKDFDPNPIMEPFFFYGFGNENFSDKTINNDEELVLALAVKRKLIGVVPLDALDKIKVRLVNPEEWTAADEVQMSGTMLIIRDDPDRSTEETVEKLTSIVCEKSNTAVSPDENSEPVEETLKSAGEGFLTSLARTLGVERNVLRENKATFIFSKQLVFDKKLGAMLPALVKTGMKAAVIVQNDAQRDLINELNKVRPENGKIICAGSIAEVMAAAHTPIYYYFKMQGDPEETLSGVTTFNVTDILEDLAGILGKLSGMVGDMTLEKRHELERRFAEAA